MRFENYTVCVYNGTVYRSGSAMTTSSLCTYCYCIEGQQRCIQPKCTLPTKGCEPILIDSTCCPVRYDCTEKKSIKNRYNTKYNRRRNDNKHYLRMTSRMQRSRGGRLPKHIFIQIFIFISFRWNFYVSKKKKDKRIFSLQVVWSTPYSIPRVINCQLIKQIHVKFAFVLVAARGKSHSFLGEIAY